VSKSLILQKGVKQNFSNVTKNNSFDKFAKPNWAQVKKILCNELLFTHTSPCEFYKTPDKHWPQKKQDKLPQVLLGGQDKLFVSS
jgi:hypothetical protein